LRTFETTSALVDGPTSDRIKASSRSLHSVSPPDRNMELRDAPSAALVFVIRARRFRLSSDGSGATLSMSIRPGVRFRINKKAATPPATTTARRTMIRVVESKAIHSIAHSVALSERADHATRCLRAIYRLRRVHATSAVRPVTRGTGRVRP
jgi:hypothetical protein